MKRWFLLFLGVLLLFAGASAQDVKPIGMVVSLQGSAVASAPAGEPRELGLSADIFLNDSIRTAPSSRLQILFNDDSIFAQGENSEMTVDEYVFNPGNAAENGLSVKLGKGLFRTVTGKITDLNPERFSVRTSRANIGIRGCDLGFEITAKEDRISVFVIPEGKQIFVSPFVGQESLIIEAPLHVTVDDSGAITRRELSGADRSRVQQRTTPGAKLPEEPSLNSGIGGDDLNAIIQNTLQDDLQNDLQSDLHHH